MIVVNGSSTSSRRPTRMLTSLRAVSFKGNKVRLEDQRKYTDWSSGLHGAIFGANPTFLAAGLNLGCSHGPSSSIVHVDEHIAAEMLAQLYPCVADMAIRWMCNGSDACSAAAKLARSVTGRESIVSYGYHGFGGTFAAPPVDRVGLDCRQGTYQSQQNGYISIDWLGEIPGGGIFEQASAVIAECSTKEYQNPKAGKWVRELFQLAHRHGAITILDEVVTGFRYQSDGATGYYGLHKDVDLWCFGKAMSNGHPISALVGKPDIMGELAKGTHCSATFFGHPLGLSMAKATLHQLLEHPPWEHLYEIGEFLKLQWNTLDLPWKLVGHPTRPVLDGDDDRLDDLRRWLFRHGHIAVKAPWYVSTATEKVDVFDLVKWAERWQKQNR